jgi:GntR family transcriptional regulator, vanillate catabolism transcriptional regulator
MSDHPSESTVYNRILEHVFSGELAPGTKVIEGQLARQLGVSRIPIRESLRRMVGQGLLTSEGNGGGIRMRDYAPEDLRQLFEMREVLEGGIARAAARAATPTDLSQLEMICAKAEQCIVDQESRERWGELDHTFHAALADASHNRRMADALKTLLTECHFLFYVFPSKAREQQQQPSPEEVARRRRRVLTEEHRPLLELIGKRDVEGAVELASRSIREGGQRTIQTFIASKLAR